MVDLGRFRSGDHEYFRALMRTYGPLVMGIVQRYGESRDDANDLFQEAWRLIWENRRSYGRRGMFEAWLARVAHNVGRDEHRKNKARREATSRLHQEGTAGELSWRPLNPDVELEKAEFRDALLQAMDLLYPKEREAVRLKHIEGRTDAGAAETMGVRESTVRSNVRHGLKRLRKTLKEHRK